MGGGRIHKGRQDLMSMLGRRRELCSLCAGGECVCKTRALAWERGPTKDTRRRSMHPWALTPYSSIILLMSVFCTNPCRPPSCFFFLETCLSTTSLHQCRTYVCALMTSNDGQTTTPCRSASVSIANDAPSKFSDANLPMPSSNEGPKVCSCTFQHNPLS